ncbi:60S ribosomal protein L14-B [Cyberlindnera jadinii]|uniref:60S ribosomal protein L14-B n=1 Tax=Cyberlindnera jadinii (strain ATCC 18201 / CBS 1600 / BCRC 20928 / JCM 3617 / NBRC 0987 / NRRL Y-1542) TaxID=983966 RepID=A0A0H5CA25_CYBJN|nr:60S ribosomal protein L14-B [Cyberlindnera jadinii]
MGNSPGSTIDTIVVLHSWSPSSWCHRLKKFFNNQSRFSLNTEEMSTETTVKASNWRLVEVGRVVLVNKGQYKGKLATIVEIIDHKRVSFRLRERRERERVCVCALVDGPTTGVPRQSISLAHVVLTPLTYSVPRGARTATVAKKFTAAGVSEKWAQSSWAKKIAQRETRRGLSDFDRFKVLVLKKQQRFAVKKALAKA